MQRNKRIPKREKGREGTRVGKIFKISNGILSISEFDETIVQIPPAIFKSHIQKHRDDY